MNTPERIYVDSGEAPYLDNRLHSWDVEYIRADLFPRWVSVKERLPEKDGSYLVIIQGCSGFAPWEWDGVNWENGEKAVTHWLDSVPPLPKEAE